MSILLSEINRYLTKQFICDPKYVPDDECQKEAKVVVAMVIKYLEEPCREHHNFAFHRLTMSTYGWYKEHRYLCPECMTKIKKELGI